MLSSAKIEISNNMVKNSLRRGHVFEIFEGSFRFLSSQVIQNISIPWESKKLYLKHFHGHCDNAGRGFARIRYWTFLNAKILKF